MSRSDDRLTLSIFMLSDAPTLAAVDGDPEHRHRFDFPADFIPSVEHSAAVITRWEAERRAGTRFPFAVRDPDTGELVGGCELTPAGEGTAQLSYWTHPRHRGSGVASEAVRQACILAFSELGFRRIEVLTDPDNLASRRVAIHNGFAEHCRRDRRILYLREAGT